MYSGSMIGERSIMTLRDFYEHAYRTSSRLSIGNPVLKDSFNHARRNFRTIAHCMAELNADFLRFFPGRGNEEISPRVGIEPSRLYSDVALC